MAEEKRQLKVIRIPRRDNPELDEAQASALAIVDRFVGEFKKLLSEIEYGSVAIEATVHSGRVVKMDVARRVKLDVSGM